ncbi:glycosyl transferase family 2 [Variibacter gotjawalensis]|uniref:Glycosyl transferase family 2 n=1 Tax=Variibacter gotjawalensis TaxID=1333996 RepID=A0A0S3Q121_9BRAD|nr:glycosyltransferase [Variibacter gotjawalensis]NIK47707.1 cellulose synthase/poly-beta-1,6-N-acetylglucosamine synthase-like glycosyltransferase [Variibacter gotjawalensis]RZS49601.1 glycosyl transferase family 2 [Variibacter gotjawalensis]BAT61864.1 glycosyl transferase family 2 [Variibacter gotjawalensis]
MRPRDATPRTSDVGSAFCICVPARDEEQRLPILLNALADQDIDGLIPIAICLNNSVDRSDQMIEEARIRHRGRLKIHLDRCSFSESLAHAGSARSAAMQLGARTLTFDGVLLTTDADARPPLDWVRENLRAIAAGADIVGGKLELDECEPLTSASARAQKSWALYWRQVREIEDAIDLRPDDPPPRHGDHTGASLALTLDIFRRAGGVPLIPIGEDRALVDAAVMAGGRLVHPLRVWTRVSPRYDGRAAGGMAETMRTMDAKLSAGHELMVPAFAHWLERARWRRSMRDNRTSDAEIIAAERTLPPMPHDMRLAEMAGD